MSLFLIDPNFCITHKTNPLKINQYHQLLINGANFPPIEVLQIGQYFVVRDGNHRTLAHLQAGELIWANVYQIWEYESHLWLLGNRIALAKKMNYNQVNEKTSSSK